MIKRYQFGEAGVEIRLPQEMPIPENMKLFESENVEVHHICELKFEDDLKFIEEQFREKNQIDREIVRKNIKVLVSADKECRILNFEGAKEPYAVYIEESKDYTHTWVSTQVCEMLQYETVFGSLLGLEKIVLRSDALILHSAYMCRDGKAILFSAPSGTGKSTQADLWTKYRGTRTVNGDKSLLVRRQDGWYAYGWPICGSSEICYNESYPIQAIVMIHQAKENSIERLGVAGAVKRLLSQITMNMWNTEFQLKTIDKIVQLVMEIPVYEMGCDISENAVKCLETIL